MSNKQRNQEVLKINRHIAFCKACERYLELLACEKRGSNLKMKQVLKLRNVYMYWQKAVD